MPSSRCLESPSLANRAGRLESYHTDLPTVKLGETKKPRSYAKLKDLPGLWEKLALVKIHGIAIGHSGKKIGHGDFQRISLAAIPSQPGQGVGMSREILEEFP
jgi:hypothetical protein